MFKYLFGGKCAALSLVTLGLFFGSSHAVLADEVDEAVAADIREVLERTQPDMEITGIEPSPLPGLYAVHTESLQTIYASEDARYFIPGDLFEVHPEGLVNRTEEGRNRVRVERLDALPKEEMISFPAEGEERATLYAFTDVDCPYCRQFHGQIDELNGMGISVHYLAFPRRGMDHETADTMISVWCADDRGAMLTSAKRDASITERECDNPVERHYALGRELGVEGTPALVLEDGYIINGFVPADTLGDYLLGDNAP